MVNTLFPNFLTDTGEYAKAESLWRERWMELLRRLSQERLWQTPWLNNASRDGNPILSAVCPSRHLGIRIIQVEPENDPNEFASWTGTFGDGEPDAIKEIVIHCVLSDVTLRKAEEILIRWISDEAAAA